MSNKVYDIINKIQRFLPAVASFYLVLVAAWGLPYGSEIEKTIMGVAALLAVFLEVWTGVWKKQGNSIEIRNVRNDLEQVGKEVEEDTMKVFDDVIGKEVDVQEEITPEIGKEMKIDDPKEWKELKEDEQ